MEITCPGCQKRLSIPDQLAGQLVKCPLCMGMFSAPALAPKSGPAQVPPPTPPLAPSAPVAPPMAPPVAPPLSAPITAPPIDPLAPLPFSSDPYPPPPSRPSEPAPPPPTIFLPEEEEPIAPGDYTRTRTCLLRADLLRWIAPVCLILILLLSFFPWAFTAPHFTGDAPALENLIPRLQNLWELAFSTGGSVSYIFYVVLTFFLTLPLALAKLSMEKNWMPMPAVLRPYWRWRSALIGGLLLVTFLFPLIDFLRWNFAAMFSPMSFAMKVAFRIHLIALIACGLEYWMDERKKKHLPPPEFTLRW